MRLICQLVSQEQVWSVEKRRRKDKNEKNRRLGGAGQLGMQILEERWYLLGDHL